MKNIQINILSLSFIQTKKTLSTCVTQIVYTQIYKAWYGEFDVHTVCIKEYLLEKSTPCKYLMGKKNKI